MHNETPAGSANASAPNTTDQVAMRAGLRRPVPSDFCASGGFTTRSSNKTNTATRSATSALDWMTVAHNIVAFCVMVGGAADWLCCFELAAVAVLVAAVVRGKGAGGRGGSGGVAGLRV